DGADRNVVSFCKRRTSMKKLQMSLCAVAAYLLIVLALGAVSSRPATGQKGGPPVVDVRVTNTSSGPVPVTGKVNVGSLPAIQLDSSNPLNVRDADNPARQPFQAYSELGGSGKVVVPTGKRLVIETATGNAYSAGNVFWMSVQTTANGMYSS